MCNNSQVRPPLRQTPQREHKVPREKVSPQGRRTLQTAKPLRYEHGCLMMKPQIFLCPPCSECLKLHNQNFFRLSVAGPGGRGPAHQEEQTGVLISGLWGELNVGAVASLSVSLPLHLPPLTLNNLGLMETPSFPPGPLSPPPSLLVNTKGRIGYLSTPPSLTAVSLSVCPNTPRPQRENGYYLYSLVPSVLPSSSPQLSLMPRESSDSRLQSPSVTRGGAVSTARPDAKHWPASVTKRVNTGDPDQDEDGRGRCSETV